MEKFENRLSVLEKKILELELQNIKLRGSIATVAMESSRIGSLANSMSLALKNDDFDSAIMYLKDFDEIHNRIMRTVEDLNNG